MPINFKKLNKMDIAIKSTPMTPEERAILSKIIAESREKDAKLIARIEAKMKKKKITAKPKSRKGIRT